MYKIKASSDYKKQESVVSKAVRRAADYWGLSNKHLAEILGRSEATISRLKKDQYHLQHQSKEWQLALLFLRVFRGLDATMGGHIENQKAWLNANNTALGGKPILLMQGVSGLVAVVQYIDCMRGQ